MKHTTGSLPIDDVCRIVRLLAGVAATNATSLGDKRNALLRGLGDLVGADAWIWGLSEHSESGRQPEYTCIVREGFSQDQFAKALEANEHPDMRALCAPLFAEFSADPKPLTRLRQQIVPDAVYESSDVSDVWRAAGVGPVILSFHPLGRGSASAVALYRRHDRPMFSERDSRVAHIVLAEVGWLHVDIPGVGSPDHRLAPRLRQVLNYLIQGSPRKEIAHRLGISPNTVNGYCKELYQRFGVHSQAALVRRFSHGDGGDRCANAA